MGVFTCISVANMKKAQITTQEYLKTFFCILYDLMTLSCKLDSMFPLSQNYKPPINHTRTSCLLLNRIIPTVAYLSQILSPLEATNPKRKQLSKYSFFPFSTPLGLYLNQFPACQFISRSLIDCFSFTLKAVAAHSLLLCVSALHLPSSVWEGGIERQGDRGTRDMKCSQ